MSTISQTAFSDRSAADHSAPREGIYPGTPFTTEPFRAWAAEVLAKDWAVVEVSELVKAIAVALRGTGDVTGFRPGVRPHRHPIRGTGSQTFPASL